MPVHAEEQLSGSVIVVFVRYSVFAQSTRMTDIGVTTGNVL
jgi:hypothetical protein